MKSFNSNHVDDIVRAIFNQDKVEYELDEASLSLKVKINDKFRDYALIKIGDLTFEHQNPFLIRPAFIIQNNLQEKFGAFDQPLSGDLKPVAFSDVEQLKSVLSALARAQTLLSCEGGDEYEYTVSVPDGCNKSDDIVENLQNNVRYVIKSSKFKTRSLWSLNNVYLNEKGETRFLPTGSGKCLPPVYDALLYIFSLSDEKLRQEHFKKLTEFYFDALKKALDLPDEITRSYEEEHTSTFLSVIKLELASALNSEELLKNISNYFKYPYLNQEDIYEVAANKVGNDKYELLSYHFKPLSETNGHLGQYFHLKMQLKVNDVVETYHLFAKIVVGSTDTMRELINSGVGVKEDFIYSKLFKLFQEHDLHELLDFAPKCYLSRLNGLVLEDLTSENYRSLTPNNVLPPEGVKAVLRKLAKFHACSLILEEKLSTQNGKIKRLDDDFGDLFKECIMVQEGDLGRLFNPTVQAMFYFFRKFPELRAKIAVSDEELEAKLKELFDTIFSKVKRSNSIRNVINHGDMYLGNMLLAYDNDQNIIDGVLIDYQILRYIPPGYEVLFFIFAVTTRETRQAHLQSFLDVYYETLANSLKSFGLDPDKIYSRQHFEENLKYEKSASFVVAFHYGNAVQGDSKLREEIWHDPEKFKYYLQDNRSELIELYWKDQHYRHYMRGLMEELVDIVLYEN